MTRYVRIGVILIAMAVSAGFLPRIMASRGELREVREIVVVARDMTYYVDGTAEPNPALQFRPGEQVRLRFRNEDRGMSHDFQIPAWGVATKVIESGEHAITFRVPQGASKGSYVCTTHPGMMFGSVTLQ